MEVIIKADSVDEYLNAGIEVYTQTSLRDESVKFLRGKLGEWKFDRMWNFWHAQAPQGRGLPLEDAIALHEQSFFVVATGERGAYGKVIVPQGRFQSLHPLECAHFFDDDNNEIIVDPTGKEEANMKHFFEHYPHLCENKDFEKYRKRVYVAQLEGVKYHATIDKYNIFTIEGLKKFTDVVRDVHV